jgi:hypothetical protein
MSIKVWDRIGIKVCISPINPTQIHISQDCLGLGQTVEFQ